MYLHGCNGMAPMAVYRLSRNISSVVALSRKILLGIISSLVSIMQLIVRAMHRGTTK